MSLIVDCHAHFYPPEFPIPEIQALLSQTSHHIVCVSEDPTSIDSILQCLEIPKYSQQVHLCFGLHPAVANLSESMLRAVELLVTQNSDKLVGIGEIGLDFTPHILQKQLDTTGLELPALKHLQSEVFTSQVKLANTLGLCANIHSRNAGHYAVDILRQHSKTPLLLHAFDGRPKYITEALQNGAYFSVAPIIARSDVQQRLVRLVPLERLVVETDAPALAAVKGNRSKPGEGLEDVIAYIAQQKGISQATAEATILQNSLRLFPRLEHSSA